MSIRSSGFTLVELVITIVVMVILSATAMINIKARTQHSVTTQADELRRNLSHIQLLAISKGNRLRLTLVSSNSYRVSDTAGTVLVDPATGQNFVVTLAAGVTISESGGSPLDFDTLGRPQLAGVLINADHIFTLQESGGTKAHVTVRPITGFATTSYN